MKKQPGIENYPLRIEPLSKEEGGGYTITAPDLPGFRGDGDTIKEALADAREAFAAWVDAQRASGRAMPVARQGGEPARFVARLPASLHARLTDAAKAEGVSMNTLLTLLVADGLRQRPKSRRLAMGR